MSQEAVNKRWTRMDFAVLSWNADATKVSTLTQLLYPVAFLLSWFPLFWTNKIPGLVQYFFLFFQYFF